MNKYFIGFLYLYTYFKENKALLDPKSTLNAVADNYFCEVDMQENACLHTAI